MKTIYTDFTLNSFQIVTRQKLQAFQHPQKSIASKYVAQKIAECILDKQNKREKCVLGLATGSTPMLVYKELIRLHQEEGLSFKNVVTFNLDEYFPMTKEDVNSYHYFMHHHLFDHIDIPQQNIYIPSGEINWDDIYAYCKSYETAILLHGGIDIQLLGIGRTGHVGFNEPGSGLESKTRMIELDSLTRKDAVKDFGVEDQVPEHAITMGVRTILNSRKIFLMAWGARKADILHEAFCKPFNEEVPASFLQSHPNVELVLDNEAAQKMLSQTSDLELEEILKAN